MPNAKASYTYGSLVTDSVATWLKKGFICGPFDNPPFSKFRSNCLMAVDQHEKIRLVLNVSLPEDLSFNSNICKEKLEKVNPFVTRKKSAQNQLKLTGEHGWGIRILDVA